MGNDFCVLVSVLDEGNEKILKCAIKLNSHEPIPQIGNTLMAPANKRWLSKKLPLHVRNCGPIVDAEVIFEIEDKTQ